MGAHSAGWHNELFRKMSIALIQMDELYAAIVRSIKEARWLWSAIDPASKVIPSLHLGDCKSVDAYALAHDLEERLDDDCVPALRRTDFAATFTGSRHILDISEDRNEHGRIIGRLMKICYMVNW